MNDEQKKNYLEKYYQEKQKGVKFWPDIIYKDLLISFAIFLILVMLATFVGVAVDPRADPSDATYVPRPEWYFLWLFEFLKYIPGEIEWVGATIIPGGLVLLLFLLPFIDRNPRRFWKKRPIAVTVMILIILAIVGLTISANASTPPQVETGTIAGTVPEKIAAGGDLYSVYCSECHGVDGDVTVIQGVEGLEGKNISPISSKDVIYTRTDDTLRNIIEQGQQELGMPPFGKAYGGELSPGDIEAIVTYMRYTWDDRVVVPEEATQAGAIPALVAGEVPSWDKHIEPLFKRYCGSCHRPGKKNNNYLVQTYEDVLGSGDHVPNLIAGDLNSNLIRMINREDLGDIGGVMPPTKALPEELVKMIQQWVLAGMPKTAEEAATAAGAPQTNTTSSQGTPTPVAIPTESVSPVPDGTSTQAPPTNTVEQTPTASPTPKAPTSTLPSNTDTPTPTAPPPTGTPTPTSGTPYP